MLKVEKDGYIISQAENAHIMIYKDNEMLFHASRSKPVKNKEELLQVLDNYFKLMDLVDKVD